ncbi:MAG: cupin domain-containing protein [Symploca sp. SIO3E6]|nr:cupin domain-containing protein [Caldora sp. SIO3E6]
MFLDGNKIDIKQGDLITIKPGVVHQALEQDDEPLEILVIEVLPAFSDVYRV